METDWIIAIFIVLIIVPIVSLVIIHYRKGNTGNGGGNGGGNGSGRGRSYAAHTAIQGAINRQNCYRKAAGLGELKVDPVLTKRSQDWVNYLAKNENCTMRHPGTTGNSSECQKYLNGACGDISGDGQNIAWRESSQAVDIEGASAFNWAVDGWYDECQGYKDHGWNRNPGNNPETGHYTQLMWKNATRIGCGAARCGANTVLVNCNYGANNNQDGGAGNLNPPSDGGKYPTSTVPIVCGIDCGLKEPGQASASYMRGKVHIGKSLTKK